MFAIRNEDFESDSDSNFEDEDELTRIIPPEGIYKTNSWGVVIIFVFLVEDTTDCLKSRHILGILGFLGFANVYAMRVNLSVAIVAMVNNTAIPQPSNTSVYDHCPVPNNTNSTQPDTVSFPISTIIALLQVLF